MWAAESEDFIYNLLLFSLCSHFSKWNVKAWGKGKVSPKELIKLPLEKETDNNEQTGYMVI